MQNIVKCHPQVDKYDKIGIYQMKCMDYQTFQTRRKGNIQAIRHNNGNSVYLNCILNTGHAYGL